MRCLAPPGGRAGSAEHDLPGLLTPSRWWPRRREAERQSQFEWLEHQPSDDHLAAVAVRFRRGLTGDRAAVLSPPSAAERAMAESDEYWSYLMAGAYALVGEAEQALAGWSMR